MNATLVLVKSRTTEVTVSAEVPPWQPMKPGQALGSFSIQALERAINRARQLHPAQELGAGLSPDVAKMAGLYGWMIFNSLKEVSPDLLNADELEAVTRWI